MYVDLWGWFWEEELRAYNANDETIKRIINLARQGWEYRRNAQSQLMLASFEQAADLAIQHQNPCWELFCEYWACSTLFYHVDDLQAALQRTIQLTTRAHQDPVKHCPIRSRVYFLLADIYYEMDVFGYEDKIRESLTFIENDVPMDEDTHFRMQHRLADLAFLYEDYDDAFERVTRYMAQAQDNEFRMRSAHQLLRAIAYARGQFEIAYDHTCYVEKFARSIRSHVDIAISLLWQSVLLKQLGKDDFASGKHMHGKILFASHDLPHWPDYFDATCAWLELNEQPQQAIIQREQQLLEYKDYGSIFNLSIIHLQYCRLLGRQGHDLSAALDAAESLVPNMGNPEKYLSKLRAIRQGAYYQFPWQEDCATQ